MRRISTPIVLLGALLSTLNAAAQDCASTQPNTAVCSGNVANTFTTGSEGFTSDNLVHLNQRFERTDVTANQTGLTSTFTSPVYYKTGTMPGSVTAGVLVTAGQRLTVTDVTLEVLDASTNTVIASCTPAVFTPINNGSQTVCISISDPADLYTGRLFYYRFTFTYTTQGNPVAERFIAVDNFSYGANSNAPLPVSFVNFEAKKETAGVKLTWRVDLEADVKGYEVEKSSDGRNFTSIGFVNAAGQSAYTFTDAKVQSLAYYRIKGVDMDGKVRFSPVVTMKDGKASVILKAFPMPANKSVTIQHSKTAAGSNISLYTESGILVQSIKPAVNAQQTEVDLSNVKPGLYLVRFNDGQGGTESVKIIKQ